MITITLNDIRNLNTSLQVGDLVYATPTMAQVGANDNEAIDNFGNPAVLGVSELVGVLRQIIVTDTTITGATITLNVDNPPNFYEPSPGDFLMFSKYSQKDGDLLGYYAEATFINNSREKAELFSVGSEITINSK
jgi:hypothetical protein